jgi:hypothetical protein
MTAILFSICFFCFACSFNKLNAYKFKIPPRCYVAPRCFDASTKLNSNIVLESEKPFNKISALNILASFGKKTSIILGSALFFYSSYNTNIANAAGLFFEYKILYIQQSIYFILFLFILFFYVFKKGLEASELFSKSQKAIEVVETNYKAMETEWDAAKKSIDKNHKQTSKFITLLKEIQKETLSLENTILKLVSFTFFKFFQFYTFFSFIFFHFIFFLFFCFNFLIFFSFLFSVFTISFQFFSF